MLKKAALQFLCLLVAMGGGALFNHWHIPLAWLLGSLCTTAVLSIFGRLMPLPIPGTRLGQLTIGTTLGLYFTAPVVAILIADSGWIVLCGLLSCGMGLIGAKIYQKIAHQDAVTAFYATAIGAASDMATQASKAGARGDWVALTHSIRVAFVVSTIPFLATWLATQSFSQPPNIAAPTPLLNAPTTFILFLSSILLTLVTEKLGKWLGRHLPNPWVLMPMIPAIFFALHYSNEQIHPWIIALGQVLLGWNLGQRFSADMWRKAPRLALASIVVAFAYTLMALMLAGLLVWGLSLSWASAAIATSAGGIAEMAITAKVLQLNPPLVTSFHAVRMVLVIVLSPLLLRLAINIGWLWQNQPKR